ncbi:MAG TPA: ExbD/TolR family protein [Thermoanaerobaculia bacterium]|nr:ExbD/TolR family protein [Thermoanaerobaculia bacterium]
MALRVGGSDEELGAMSDINVTPLVDVMLVLLIIFMVTAPLLTQGLTVQLPPAEGESLESSATNPATITITGSGAVYLDDIAVGSGDLEMTLGTMLRGKRVKQALLRADQTVAYGQVVRVMDVMNRAGVEQLGMVTQRVEIGDAGRGR